MWWAESPHSLVGVPATTTADGFDPFALSAAHMALVHNSIIRGLNAIILQAPHISSDQAADFIGYCRSWHEFVCDHHTVEEEMFFPAIDEAVGETGVMDENVDQHHAFHGGLDAFDKYLSSVNNSTFDGRKLNSIIASFAPVMVQHLEDEIGSLLRLRRFGVEKLDLGAIAEETAIKAVSRLGTETGLPFFVTALDATCEGGVWAEFPPVPPIENMCKRGYWKFAPCGTDRMPKGMPEVSG